MFSTLTVFVVSIIKDVALISINSKFNIDGNINLLLFIFFILIIYTHRNNIYNLKNKTEHKIRI